MADTLTLRDAIIRGLWYTTDAPDYDDAVRLIDAILALPEMQARERIVEAARTWMDKVIDLEDAVAALDALEAERG
jgi:hypothetical protein